MFPSKKEIREAVNRLFRICEPMNRGDTLTHEQVQGVLKVPPHEGSWEWVIRKLRRKMEDERGISLVADITVGYRLATTAEQLQLGPARTRQAYRRLRAGYRSVDCLPEDELTLHQRRVKVAMTQKLVALEASIRHEARLQAFLMRPRETMPRIAAQELEKQDEGQAESA